MKKKGDLRPVIGGGLLLAATAWIAAEPVAEYIIGDPPAFDEKDPPEPKLKDPGREPMKIAVAFDVTRSPIMHQLHGVRDATRNFINSTNIFKPKDEFVVCTFEKKADCKHFHFPQDKEELLAHIDTIEPLPPAQNMQTFVNVAVREIIGEVKGGKSQVAVWTDADDETAQNERATLAANHSPVTVVIPLEGYRANAQHVKADLGSKGVDVVLAKDSASFGKVLEGFAGELQKEADKAYEVAKAKAEIDYNINKEGYAGRKAAYDKLKAASDAAKEAAKKKIGYVKHTIQGLGLAFILACLEIFRRQNRPKLYGYVTDLRQSYPEQIQLPSSAKPTALSKVCVDLPNNLILTPGKGGIYFNGQILTQITKLADGIFWSPEELQTTEIARLKPQKVRSLEDN